MEVRCAISVICGGVLRGTALSKFHHDGRVLSANHSVTVEVDLVRREKDTPPREEAFLICPKILLDIWTNLPKHHNQSTHHPRVDHLELLICEESVGHLDKSLTGPNSATICGTR